MKVIKASDLVSIPLELPTPEQQKQVEENYFAIQREYQEIRKCREAIERLSGEFWSLPGGAG